MDLSKIDFSKLELPLLLGYECTVQCDGLSISIHTLHNSWKLVCRATTANGVWRLTSIPGSLRKEDTDLVWKMTEMVDRFIAEQTPALQFEPLRMPTLPSLHINFLPEVFAADSFLARDFLPKFVAYYHRGHSGEPWTWWLVDAFGKVSRKIENMPEPPTVNIHCFLGEPGFTYDVIAVKCADYDEILRSRAVHEVERKAAEGAKKKPRLPMVKPPQGCEWFWSDVVGHVFLRSRRGDSYLSQAIPYTLDSRDRLDALVAAYDELYGGTEKKATERATPKPIELNGGRITSLFHDGRLATLGYGGTSKDSITIGVEFHRKDAAAIFRELDGMAVKSLVEMTIAKR